MLLTISTTRRPATDLGYLLHKHPGRVQSFAESVGTAHVFYPEASETRCTAALLLEVDPVGLARGRGHAKGEAVALAQYVNDRPYAASSMLAMALKDVFRTALAGRCQARPDLVSQPIPLEIAVPALPCRGGADLAGRLFGPAGWQVAATTGPLDPAVPEWGESPYVSARLTGQLRLADALNHLYVLLPVLDDAKHYWVSDDEVEKLIRAGQGWLAAHPEKALITRRYLSHRRELTASALARLAEADDTVPEELDNAVGGSAIGEAGPGQVDAGQVEAGQVEAGQVEAGQVDAGAGAGETAGPPARAVPLAEQRRAAVLAVLRECGARSVGDLGCGEGVLTQDLLAEPGIERIVATDVSARALQLAGRRLRLDSMPERQRARLQIFQSALTYRDSRLTGLDAAVLMEVIEHVDPERLGALERAVFGYAAPGAVIVTTPNAEYNVRFAALPAGALRHRDHRFEWTRGQFRSWAERVASSYGYTVRCLPVGDDDPEAGPPTQLAVFSSGRPA